MDETPEPLALLVCDQVIVEKGSNKKSLIGTFNRITTEKVPCIHPKLFVFVALHNGSGEQQATLKILHEESEEEVFKMQGPVKFENPLQVIEMGFELGNLAFPKEGVYCIQFSCNDLPVAERKLVVHIPS